MKLLMLLLLCGFVALSACGAEPNVITLGDNDKAAEMLVLSASQPVKLTTDQRSPQGLSNLVKEARAPIAYYDDAFDGALGFIGSNQVAFVTKHSLQDVLVMPTKELDAILSTAKPMAYETFRKNYQPPYPTVPMQAAPSVVVLLLKNRTSNVIVCKAPGQVFVVEIVAMADDKTWVKLKVHRKK